MKGQVTSKISWVRVPVRVVSVARKLSSIEERLQDQSCWFRVGQQRKKFHNAENLFQVQVTINIFSLTRKLSTIKEHIPKFFISSRILHKQIPEPQKIYVLAFSLGEDGFISSEVRHCRTESRPKLLVCYITSKFTTKSLINPSINHLYVVMCQLNQ